MPRKYHFSLRVESYAIMFVSNAARYAGTEAPPAVAGRAAGGLERLFGGCIPTACPGGLRSCAPFGAEGYGVLLRTAKDAGLKTPALR